MEGFDKAFGERTSTRKLGEVTVEITLKCLAPGKKYVDYSASRKKDVYSLRTPALYNARQQDLLRIISDIRTNSPYHASKIPIRAFIHFGSLLAMAKRFEDECQ